MSSGKRDFADTVKIKDIEGWGHHSVAEHLPSMQKALDLTLSKGGQKGKERK